MTEDEFGGRAQESVVDHFCRIRASLTRTEVDDHIYNWRMESPVIDALFSIDPKKLSSEEVLKIGCLAIEAGAEIQRAGTWAEARLSSFRHAMEAFEAHKKQRPEINPGPLFRIAFELGWRGPESAAELIESSTLADQLPTEYQPPDELVQGVLTSGAGSMLYGDSNSGKTFLAIDLACAVARGVPWLGRKTEAGLVVYLAAESPQSVRSRLQAYQAHHACKVPNFVILGRQIDLHDNEDDADALIETVKMHERLSDQPARLIVGDTLARLSAGANENSGSDMGKVVQRFDRIRHATGAHFMLIHHSGKNQASGARGWSGIRAAVDTEIEVTDGPKGRCAEITKQRDLPTKGERLGFELQPVALGCTKWGQPASSCIVVPAAAPAPVPLTKRTGKVEAAVLEFLRSRPEGAKKMEVRQHLAGRCDKSAVYRAIVSLSKAGALSELGDVFRITPSAG